MGTQAGKKSKMGRRKKKKLLIVRYENAGNSHKSLAFPLPSLKTLFFIYFIKHAVASSYIPSLSFFFNSLPLASLYIHMCRQQHVCMEERGKKKINLIEESLFLFVIPYPRKKSKQATSDCNHPHSVWRFNDPK
jgi:hypothetical protein